MRIPRVVIIGFQAVWGASLLLVFAFALCMASVVIHFTGDAVYPADCAIVFGSAVHPLYDESGAVVSAKAGPGITRRVSAATALYKEGSVKHLFLTGGQGEGMLLSEAEVMQRLAVSHGVRAGDITLEKESHSTEENLAFTRPLTEECTTVVGISDRYHLARIELLARLMGWEVQTEPAAWTAGNAFELRSSLREATILLGLLVQSLLT